MKGASGINAAGVARRGGELAGAVGPVAAAGGAHRHGFTHPHHSPAAAPWAGARQVQAGLPPALRGLHRLPAQCQPDGGLPSMLPVSLPGFPFVACNLSLIIFFLAIANE